MSAATFNLVIEQNSDFTLSVTLDDGVQPTPAPINLNGCQITADIRKSSLEPIIASFYVAIVNAAEGKFALNFNGAQTLELPITTAADLLRYDVLLVDANGNQERLFEGTIQVREAITF